MGLREIKNRARHDLHHAMQVGALYIPDPVDPVPAPCTVRVHTKWDTVGELKGTSFDYAERREAIPRLIFLIEELLQLPVRGAVVTITDPATGAKEAYKIDNRHPVDGITVTADVSILTPEEYADLPFPGEDWSMVAEAPLDGKMYVRCNGAWVELPAGLPEAPMDGHRYARMDGDWSLTTELLLAEYSARTTSTAANDPGYGKISWNDANQPNATELYISARNADSVNISALLQSLVIGGELLLQNKTDATHFMRYAVNSIAMQTEWLLLGVTPIASSGSSFGSNAALMVVGRYALGATVMGMPV